MYVESSYFGYHELKDTVISNKTGYFVTKDLFISDLENGRDFKVPEKDYFLYGAKFTFLKNIENYKIYYWESM